MADISLTNATEHNKWDIYHIWQLKHSLIPKNELELLAKLNSYKEKNPFHWRGDFFILSHRFIFNFDASQILMAKNFLASS